MSRSAFIVRDGAIVVRSRWLWHITANEAGEAVRYNATIHPGTTLIVPNEGKQVTKVPLVRVALPTLERGLESFGLWRKDVFEDRHAELSWQPLDAGRASLESVPSLKLLCFNLFLELANFRHFGLLVNAMAALDMMKHDGLRWSGRWRCHCR